MVENTPSIFEQGSPLQVAYQRMMLHSDTTTLDASRTHKLASYVGMYNDLLRRILPITYKTIPEEQLGKILRRGVIPAFQKAQEATTDQLTGLPKRDVLHDITERYIDLVKDGINGVVTFVYIDIDNFKMDIDRGMRCYE